MRSSCGLTTLERPEGRGTVIETYKLMTRKAVVPYEEFSAFAHCISTRGHTICKLFRKRLRANKKPFSVQGFYTYATVWTSGHLQWK